MQANDNNNKESNIKNVEGSLGMKLIITQAI